MYAIKEFQRDETEKIRDNVDNLIKEQFKITWCAEDFLDAWKEANGIEGELTVDQWREFETVMRSGLLRGFKEVVTQEINERIAYLF